MGSPGDRSGRTTALGGFEARRTEANRDFLAAQRQ